MLVSITSCARFAQMSEWTHHEGKATMLWLAMVKSVLITSARRSWSDKRPWFWAGACIIASYLCASSVVGFMNAQQYDTGIWPV